jgi:hypothetical protein
MIDRIALVTHSGLVGGSTAARRVACPRSYALERLMPDPSELSPYAIEGTALHEYMARVLNEAAPPLPWTFTSPDGWTKTVTPELWAEKGQPALDAFDRFVAEIEDQWGLPFEFEVEKRCVFPGIEGAFGTTDIIGRCGPEVFVIDWKFGNRPVDAVENWQLMFYAVAALHSFPEFFASDDPQANLPSRPVTGVIIQPTSEDGISVWETDVATLNEMAEDLRAAVRLALEQGADAPVHKGSHCQFARCKPICPLWVGDAIDLAERIAELEAARAASREDLGTLLGDMLALADAATEWANAVHAAALTYATEGGEVAGHKLVEKRAGARSWAVPEADVFRFFRNRRFRIDDYAPRALVSVAQAEKLLKAAGRELPSEMIKPGASSGYKLVKADTPGVPVVPPTQVAAELGARLANFAANAAR